MTGVIATSLTADQVNVGDQLPELRFKGYPRPVLFWVQWLAAIGALCTMTEIFAINRNRVKDIFINTPNNAAWF